MAPSVRTLSRLRVDRCCAGDAGMLRPVDEQDVLLDLGRSGSRLTIRLGERYDAASADPGVRTWRWTEIVVAATPFAGTIRTLLTGDDVAAFRQGIAAFLGEQRDEVQLGGYRAAEVVLRRHDETVEVAATASGDDPWPRIRYLIFPE
jgi:hypothetical protein